MAIKGAPDKLFDLAKNDPNFDLNYWSTLASRFAKSGKRVIAVGYIDVAPDVTEVTHELLKKLGITFLGLATGFIVLLVTELDKYRRLAKQKRRTA